MTFKEDLYKNLVVHMDFYESPDIVPILGMTTTDLDNRVLSQIWLRNPRFDEDETKEKIADVLNYMLEAGISEAKKPRKFTREAMETVMLEAVAHVAKLVNISEKDSNYTSLIPAPLWASTDYYTPPSENDILDLQ